MLQNQTDSSSLDLEHGDLVFIAVPTFLFRQVAAATGSWTSHVGLALRDREGQMWIYESAIPLSRRVTVESFIGRSEGGRYSVVRPVEALTDEQGRALLRAAESRLKRWYDLGFNFDAGRQFCSKFVYECYFESTGRRVGLLQSFGELLAANPEHGLRFWKWWFAGFIPWSRRTVTPVSQLESPLMRLVEESPGVASMASFRKSRLRKKAELH